MSDEYLWDRSGKPDPTIEKLERTLAPLAHDDRPLVMREPADVRDAQEVDRGGGSTARALLAAACLVLAAGVGLWASSRPVGPGWEVASVEGTPRIGPWRFGSSARLGEGQTLVTDARSRARLEVGSIGEVTLDPNSRLRLVHAGRADHRIALERGVLHAMIVAPPRHFTVETPATRAVDLGCAYTLEVAADGRTLVSVETGWVSFEHEGHEAFIPAGARCVTARGREPGTPYFADADPEMISAIDALDGAALRMGREAALPAVLEHARPQDALTLWHLLPRFQGEERAQIYERLAALSPPPEGVTREGVLAGDRVQLDLWWNSFGLGDVDWWRLWAQSPPSGS